MFLPYKKGGRNDKLNYRPVSVLPIISKVYETILFYQINDFLDSKLSPYQCGFRKGYIGMGTVPNTSLF